MKERRKFARLHSQDKAFLQKENKLEEGRVMDISPGGMRVLVSNNIKEGSIITGEFKIIPNSGNFYVLGEVMWARPAKPASFEVGIKFSKVSTVPLRAYS